MKKFMKALSVFAAVAMLGSFVACSSDDDGGSKPEASTATFETTSFDLVTLNAPASAGEIKIGDTIYVTLQAALSSCTGSGSYKITLGPGTYEENGLNYKGSASITISGLGSSAFGTDVVIKGVGSSQDAEKTRSLLEVEGSANLILENLTLKNTYVRTGVANEKSQAEALGFDSTGTLAAYNCTFLSHQDTIRTLNKSWFYKCHIEGDVDFIWMETAGKVALYEECEIAAISDEVTSQYIIAPGMTQSTKVNKGVVIYKSKLKGNNGTYLFRSPWAVGSGKYNNGAFVNCALDGTLNGDLVLAGNIADGIGNQSKVGWKVDAAIAAKYTSKNSTIGTISQSDLTKEFNGRRAILNRYYDVTESKYVKDYDAFWDIDAVITATGWTVTEDTSKDLLDGEKAITSVTYVLDGASDVSALTFTNFAQESGKTHYVGNSGAKIEVPLTGKCTVVVTGYYKGAGTISAGTQPAANYNFTNGSTTKFIEKEYVVYTAGVTSAIIEATGTSYITKIVVKYDDTITFKPVTGISVTCDAAEPKVGTPANVTATVTPANATNRDVDWSSSDTAIATVDADGKVAFKSAGQVTITATAKDGSGKTGSVTLNPAAATWTSAEWYFNYSTEGAANSGKGFDATYVAGKENTAFSTKYFSGITIGDKRTVTLLDGTTADITAGLKMDGNGEMYITVSKEATLTVKQANNYSGYLVIASADGTATAASTNPTAAITGDVDYVWTLTAGSYTVKRNNSSTGAIYYAKCVLAD